MKLIRYRFLPYFIIMLAVTLSYFPSFSGGFLLDDNFLIKNNPFIKTPHPMVSYFNQEDGIVRGKSWVNAHTGYYRPFVNLTYRMDYLIWGINPNGFRVTNVILHLLTCFLLFNFVLLFVQDRPSAFWATLLFALHPVNTETVSWISSRNNILVTLFSLICMYNFVKWRENRGSLRLAASAFFFIPAVFSKEFGLIVLPCLFFYQRLISTTGRNLFDEITGYLPFFLVAAGYFLLRKTTTGSWITPAESIGLLQRIYFSPYLVMWNLILILFPYGLHSFVVHYPANYFHWQALTSIVCLSAFSFVLWFLKENRLLIFGIVSFIFALFPILNIFRTSAVTLISMRWLYFPMIFAALVLARMVGDKLRSSLYLSIAILFPVSIYFGVYSHILNKYLWHDEHAFYSQEVEHFNNASYYGGLAEDLFNRKELVRAEKYFRMAIDAYPNTAKNYINYGALLIEVNRAEDALNRLYRARDLSMTKKERLEWYNNIGTAYFGLKKYDQALANIKKAIAIDPDESYLWVNLGAGYAQIGDYMNAVSSLKNGLARAPDSVEIKKKLAIVYLRMGNYTEAISILESIPRKTWRENGVDRLLDNARKHLEFGEFNLEKIE